MKNMRRKVATRSQEVTTYDCEVPGCGATGLYSSKAMQHVEDHSQKTCVHEETKLRVWGFSWDAEFCDEPGSVDIEKECQSCGLVVDKASFDFEVPCRTEKYQEKLQKLFDFFKELEA